MDSRIYRILSVANAMSASRGSDKDCASTGEQIAGAIVAGHHEWAGFTDSDGYSDTIAMIGRLGQEWFEIARQAQDTSR
ncbi:hypothetical protein J7355_16210 [Endozoicomonas sp. G2_2]|uniref:hypothetical protein n=1 Tax=Endozoicomonas sp. G2_2 TaxID=2821092 RepID=UPI001ADD4126|nr:hypothetical protein [Endozoicomonas sp. G2_2]MBO9471634.1 hypothetical protein [Endozoicomonas sp. G2_2]